MIPVTHNNSQKNPSHNLSRDQSGSQSTPMTQSFQKSITHKRIKRLTKKAQVIGQVFVYILAAVTFVLISLFGYNAITQFVGNSEQVEFLSFKNSFERSVKDIYTEYGAVRQEKYSLPAEYSKICLVNLNAGSDKFTPDKVEELCSHNALACSVVNEMLSQDNGNANGLAYGKFDSNVFLSPTSPYPIKLYRFTLCDIHPDGTCTEIPYLCTPLRSGLLNLVLEGKGDHTEISLPQSSSTEEVSQGDDFADVSISN